MRHPVLIAAGAGVPENRRNELQALGAGFIGAEIHRGRIALPELLEDLAARGIHSLMVEGGAEIARSFLDEGLVDRIALFTGNAGLGPGAIPSPVAAGSMPPEFELVREAAFGEDRLTEWARRN